MKRRWKKIVRPGGIYYETRDSTGRLFTVHKVNVYWVGRLNLGDGTWIDGMNTDRDKLFENLQSLSPGHPQDAASDQREQA